MPAASSIPDTSFVHLMEVTDTVEALLVVGTAENEDVIGDLKPTTVRIGANATV